MDLQKITAEAYQFFRSIEMCIRRYLTIMQAKEMDDTFKQHLKNVTLSDDVLFYWCLAGQIEGDEAADRCLTMIIDKWITIRGFSFAKSILESYKQETKKGTNKAKSLCSTLFS